MVRPHDHTEGGLIARLGAAENIGIKVWGAIGHLGLTTEHTEYTEVRRKFRRLHFIFWVFRGFTPAIQG
jgi:hypothetical protein